MPAEDTKSLVDVQLSAEGSPWAADGSPAEDLGTSTEALHRRITVLESVWRNGGPAGRCWRRQSTAITLGRCRSATMPTPRGFFTTR